MLSNFTKITLPIILNDVKECILNHCSPLKFIVIGSNKNGIISETDIDIIIIVKDNIDLFTLSQEIAPILSAIGILFCANIYWIFPIPL